MQTQTQLEQDRRVEEKVQKVKELYADAPELGRITLEKGLPNLTREFAAATGTQNAGRIGARQGKVSELTGIIPFAKGGAKRLRGLLQALEGNFRGGDAVGTLHDMRFVFLDNDTKLLAAASWYVASPNLTQAETLRLERIGKALDEFLDKISA
jgi:hypothetical protein